MVSLLVASVLKCILVHGLNLLLVATLTAIHAGQVLLVYHPCVLWWLQILSGIVNKSWLALLLFFSLVIVPIHVSFNIISSFFFILLNHVLQMLSGIVNKSCLALLLFLFFYLVIVPILVSFNIISSFFFILLNHVLISFLTC